MPCIAADLCRLLARVALIYKSYLDLLASDFLHHLTQLTDLRPVLFTGRRDTKRKQMAECVNSQMDLAAFAALRPIIASAGAAFWRRLQRTAIKVWLPKAPRSCLELCARQRAGREQGFQRRELSAIVAFADR